MANKSFDFFVRFIDPEEAARTTPAKRRERVAGSYNSTSVGRALTKFFNEQKEDNGWLKKDLVILDVMRSPKQVGPQMDDGEDE